MGLTDLVVLAGVEQDTLGSGGLTGIDVSHDAEVSGVFQRILSRHSSVFSLITNGNERKPCWLRPSCGHPRAS